jgi:hypothetical protein
MRIVLTNLSNKLFENSRSRLNESARKFGIKEIRSLDFEELKTSSFYTENQEILDQPNGIGYWLWKPFIILESMKTLSEGDIVIYSDCGIEIIDRLEALISLCSESEPVLLFGNGNFTNSMWIKRDCFVLMNCDSELYWKGPHCDAAFSLFRKNKLSLQFLGDWLEYARDKRILTDLANTCGKRNLRGFLEHKWDQAILSLLAQKYQFPLYRMPSQFGNHYKIPRFRRENEFNCINQSVQVQVNYYAIIPYYNSDYPQLLNHHRTKNNQKPVNKTAFNRAIRIAGKLKVYIKNRLPNPFLKS